MQPENMPKVETTPIPIVEFALSYARNNWPVFPLHGKIPFKDSKGYKDATTNEEQIKQWWSQHPTANIGLATGERSGILVLDIDMPGGHFSLKELQKTYAPLPDTRRVRTAHKGMHYYFQHPDDGHVYKNAVALQGKIGVDFRAKGGYIAAPPSNLYGRLFYLLVNPDTPIAPLPIWLRDLLIEGEQQREEYPQGLRFAGSPGDLWLAQALDKAREGNRNAIGFWMACQLRDDNVPEPEARRIGLLYANLAPQGNEQYTSKEILASVRSAYKRPPREPAKRIHP